MDKFISLKPFLQEDGKVPGAYVNTKRRFLPSFSHKKDELNLTQYIKDIVATVLTGASATFVSITALAANIGKNLFGFGTATAPSITFNGDDNTGIYRSAADTIGFTTGGSQRATLSSSGLAVVNVVSANGSSAAAPSYAFTSDPDTGIWNSFTNQIGFAAGGTDVARLGTNGLKFTKVAVSQSTNISTTVAAGNAYCGLITTQGATAVAGATNTFTVTNSAVTGNSDVILINIVDYAGSTGKPVVQLDAIGSGTFDVVITNVDTTNALNGILTLAFVVL